MSVEETGRWRGRGLHNKGVRYFAHTVQPQGYVQLWFLDPGSHDERHFQPCAKHDIPLGWTGRQVTDLIRQRTDGLIDAAAFRSRLTGPPPQAPWWRVAMVAMAAR